MNKLIYTVLTVLFFFCVKLNASEKNKIIENLKKINSLQFNFTQISNGVEENGSCILVYSKKMRCVYYEEKKEIIINDDYLYLINKKENKNYNYNIENTPLGVMLDKESLIEKLSNVERFNIINNNIVAAININSTENIDIYFDPRTFTILGWKIINYDKSTLVFLMKDILININSGEKFQIPN
ncbi:MAG: hypothetical protein CK535_05535 [Pelagibacteraceae bacterium]|nr:MAG: hypothetical protein CK535_05535 [Pelagibacteraceae bacterium]